MPIHRTFETSTKRRQINLEGTWDLQLDPDDRGLAENWPLRFPSDARPTWVPGVWNTHRDLRTYEGVAWYRRRVTLNACSAALLHFAAVTHQANVWLDGEPLGEHYGGFLPFSFVIPQPQAGECELVVRVDNTPDLTSTIPSAAVDGFRYGGIFRPVWLEELEHPGHVASLRLTPTLVNGVPTLRVRAELINVSDDTVQDEWRLYVDDVLVRSERCRLRPHDAEVLLFAVDLPQASLWTPTSPRLSTARVEFAGDDLIERTGFRQIALRGDRIYLNGEPLRLHGVNRHEDHPDWGPALPLQAMTADLALIEDLGVNAIRGAHYPNDQRMLDLCDERGLLFLEELPLWSFGQEQLRLDIVADRAAAMLWAMVERDAAHPCIWAWSLLSDCATDTPEGRLVLEHLAETARELDPTRLVTYATDRGVDDLCFDLVDVIGLNAWLDPQAPVRVWAQYLDEVRSRMGAKPILVSAFGVGGVEGCQDRGPSAAWREQGQPGALIEALEIFLCREDLAGFFVWQLCDACGVGSGQGPRGDGQSLLTASRQPKPAYEAVRRLLRDARAKPAKG